MTGAMRASKNIIASRYAAQVVKNADAAIEAARHDVDALLPQSNQEERQWVLEDFEIAAQEFRAELEVME